MRTSVFFLAAAALSGCFVVDAAHYQRLTGQDAGTDAQQPSEVYAVDTCGASNTFVFTQTTRNIAIDTRTSNSDIATTCRGPATTGNDVFFAVNVQAGEFWHFHLRVDPTDPTSVMSRDPAFYLLQTGCDARVCRFASDACDGNLDEHFAFKADARGTWYLGIDDRNPGGGRYLLDAIRPVCGDGVAEHGEACDDGNTVNDDRCDNQCRATVGGESGFDEKTPNDNEAEANHILLPTSRTMQIQGAIGGEGDCYPDVFVIDVPQNATLTVRSQDMSNVDCASATTTPFQFALRNARGDAVGGTVTSGCPEITYTNGPTSATTYYIWLSAATRTTALTTYRMRVSVTP